MASLGGKEGKREGDWDRVGGSRDLDSYFMQIHGHSPPDKLIHCERGKKTSKTISILCWCCCWCRELCILFVVAVFLLLLFFFCSVIEMRVGLWGWTRHFFFHYLTGNGAGSPDFHENAALLLYKLIPRFSLSLGRSCYLLWWNMSFFFLVLVF